MPVRYFPPEYCIRPRSSAEKPSGAQASIGKPFERTAARPAISAAGDRGVSRSSSGSGVSGGEPDVSGTAVGAAVFSGASAPDGRRSSETTPITAPRSSAASSAQRTMRPARGRVLSAVPPEWSERFAIGLLSFYLFWKKETRGSGSLYKTEGERKSFTPPRSCNNIPADRRSQGKRPPPGSRR